MPWFSYHGGHSGQFCRHAKDMLAAVVERFDLTRLFRWIGVVWPWALVLAGVALVVLALARRKT